MSRRWDGYAIISPKVSLYETHVYRKYQRTHRRMITSSKCRPRNSAGRFLLTLQRTKSAQSHLQHILFLRHRQVNSGLSRPRARFGVSYARGVRQRYLWRGRIPAGTKTPGWAAKGCGPWPPQRGFSSPLECITAAAKKKAPPGPGVGYRGIHSGRTLAKNRRGWRIVNPAPCATPHTKRLPRHERESTRSAQELLQNRWPAGWFVESGPRMDPGNARTSAVLPNHRW
jgi:hypothetical protein